MTTGRSYRQAMSVGRAGDHLDNLAGSQFDPEIVDAFSSIDRSLLTPQPGDETPPR